jgi:hypothetical protein
MTFLLRCQELKEGISQLKYWQSGRDETKKLKEKSDELMNFLTWTSQYENLKEMFQEENLNPPILVSYQDISAIVENISNRFKKESKHQTLVKGKHWKNLEVTMESFKKEGPRSLSIIWHNFLKNCFSGESPESLSGSVVKTDYNKPLLKQYIDDFQEFRSLYKKFPTGSEDFNKTRSLAQSLKEILSKLDRDVPKSIERFLSAVNVHNGAPLDYLNDEVVSWLKDNNEYTKYKILHK